MAAAARFVLFLLTTATFLQGESLELDGRLVRFTPAPTPGQVRPYPRCLATYLYEVEKVHLGAFRGRQIVVAKWAVWNRTALPALPSEVNTIERLKLDRFVDHPGLKTSRIVDGIRERELVLYYDPSSRPPPAVARALTPKTAELASGAVEGEAQGWLFLADELEHARTGRFWEKPWKESSCAGVSPLPALLDVQKRLRALDVNLLVVPVPTKVSIYPERLAEGLERSEAPTEYLQLLKHSGLRVLDLHPLFRDYRAHPEHELLYCAQDSHWTPQACRLAARAIYRTLEGEDPPLLQEQDLRPATRHIRGDLARMRADLALPPERLSLEEVRYPTGQNSHGYHHPGSDLVLLGDSNVVVFSDPLDGLHGPAAGLPDYLSAFRGRPVDVIASFGDGVHQARLNLYRGRSRSEAGYWKNKSWVVWCFSMREFTRAAQWSTKVPVARRKLIEGAPRGRPPSDSHGPQ